MMHNEHKKSGSLLTTLILPITAAAAALLFAPQTGRELRAELKNRAMNLKETGMEKVATLKDDFVDTYSEVSEEMDMEEEPAYDVADLVSNVANIPDASNDPAAGVGNVRDTPFESVTDETVPSDKLDEALADNDIASESDLLTDEPTK